MTRVIVVDGEIGAGKTTLIQLLKEHLTTAGYRVFAIPEPVELWREVGILGRFMQDPARYAYPFQTFTFVTRIQSAIDALEPLKNAKSEEKVVVILERSIHTDRFVFMELQRGVVGVDTMKMYEQWCGLFARLMPVDLSTATYLYLKPELGRCMARVAKRARREELCAEPQRVAAPRPLHAFVALLAVAAFTAVYPATVAAMLVILLGVSLPMLGLAALFGVLFEGDAKKEQPPAKGGVGIHYQQMLREAHEALLEGKHAEKYPLLRQQRPFPTSSAHVIDGAAANEDFSVPGADREKTIATIVKRLGL